MVTTYHGTIAPWHESILRDGLIPTIPEKQWKANLHWKDYFFGESHTFNPSLKDEKGFTYLALTQEHAEEYARFKAAYARALPGSSFHFAGELLIPMDVDKQKDAPYIPDAKPIVLKVVIPDDLYRSMEEDTMAYNAVRCYCSIPPKYIKPLKGLSL